MTNESHDRPPAEGTRPLDEVLELLGQQSQSGTSPGETDTGAIIPAGHVPPTPASLDDIGIAHAVDGDSTALCQPSLHLDQVNDYYWTDVPPRQRCPRCTIILDA